ncbi:MAG TPA: DEAD/DEAH box helicase family protein, partial [Alicycliphilus sp.]|nr:DEAD/DEAH box helicase family protein [Alicycliphilus sp.]
IPTGGGKTVLAAHAVPLLAREWAAVDAPVAVWLVPSDAIRQQTLKALQTPGHPYRAALADAYGEGLRVCALEDVAQIAPPEWGRNAVVVVATIQSFRIEDAGQRNVYSFSESFEPHFRGADERALAGLRDLPDALVTPEDVAADTTGVLAGFAGQPRWSLANWLALHRPILIVDEAHNAKTDKSFTALQRLNPGFILELTATPIAAKTNVLYHVSAQELAAEDMIKLPIVLAEHPEGWPAAVFGAVQTQRALEAEALKDEAAGAGYVRPIVLFQAQNTGEEMPPEKLRDYLVDELKLPANQVVVATGTQRGLDDIILAARDCPVRYVITVQALREGWDCPFAYVLCSLQRLTSATAVEQLLGRVLRMPHARRRGREALNRAYAHVCAAEFSQAAHALADRLIEHMGFEALDVASMIAPQASLPLWDGGLEPNQAPAPVHKASVATSFEAIAATPELLAVPGVQVRAIAGVPQVVVTGHIGEGTEALLLAQVRGAKKQEQLRAQVAQHNALVAAQAAPASRGAPFAPLPTLGYRLDAQAPLWPLEREAVLEAVELDWLAPQAVQLTSFQVAQESDIFEIGMDGARVALRLAGSAQMAMDWASSSIDADTLVGWLDQSLFKPLADVTQRRAYLTAVVNHQLHGCGVPLVVLAQARFKLARAIEAHVGDLRDAATRRAFQQQVLGLGDGRAWLVEPDWTHPHVFEPGRYPAPVASRYGGRYQFGKHYFPVLADLKDGGQEFQCAQLIDRHPQVRHWVRNLDTAPCGFGLPTSRGRFYADFVAELADGRVALLEFKGLLQHEPYELEKRQVGELWARSSGGKAVFGWLTFEGLAQQLDNALA